MDTAGRHGLISPGTEDFSEAEFDILLESIYRKYGYDFRHYARASLKRRALQALPRFSCESLSDLQALLMQDPLVFPRLLAMLTVPVTEMFRDPSFYLSFRKNVVPLLRTYPSLKIWVAGCCTGEEAFSIAIILKEEGLLEKSVIYGTDINHEALAIARKGIFDLEHIRKYTEAYQKAGGQQEFSAYYHSEYTSAVLEHSIRSKIVFSDHSLVTDHVFSEVNFISCRNVMIYFDRKLQERAIGLFRSALCHRGLLAIGPKETLKFSLHEKSFQAYDPAEKIYQKVAG